MPLKRATPYTFGIGSRNNAIFYKSLGRHPADWAISPISQAGNLSGKTSQNTSSDLSPFFTPVSMRIFHSYLLCIRAGAFSGFCPQTPPHSYNPVNHVADSNYNLWANALQYSGCRIDASSEPFVYLHFPVIAKIPNKHLLAFVQRSFDAGFATRKLLILSGTTEHLFIGDSNKRKQMFRFLIHN